MPTSRRDTARHRVRHRPRSNARRQQVPTGLSSRFALSTMGAIALPPPDAAGNARSSYQHLTVPEHDLLQRLPIFVGPFSLDAACAVTEEGMTAADIADGIADLIGESLVLKATSPVTSRNFACSERPAPTPMTGWLRAAHSLTSPAPRRAFADRAREHRSGAAVQTTRRISGRVARSRR